jgi:hypothetical protein
VAATCGAIQVLRRVATEVDAIAEALSRLQPVRLSVAQAGRFVHATLGIARAESGRFVASPLDFFSQCGKRHLQAISDKFQSADQCQFTERK